MNETEVKKKVEESIANSIQGLSQEKSKFDFKRQWYDFTTPKGINELLKDTCAIANTPDGDGFIVFGFDEKNKKFHPARFSDSGLRDTSDLNGIVRSRVDPEFEINILDFLYEDHPISVLHIPESANKPHVIKQFMRFSKSDKEGRPEDHRIFIRKNTSVNCASRGDLDRMYRERYGELEDYEVDVSLDLAKTVINIHSGSLGGQNLVIEGNFYFENRGKKSITISSMEVLVKIPWQNEEYHEYQMTYAGPVPEISIETQNDYSGRLKFTSDRSLRFLNNVVRNRQLECYRQLKDKIEFLDLEIFLPNGKSIENVMLTTVNIDHRK